MLTLLSLALASSPQTLVLDETWTISVGNATAPVAADGRWLVPNVIAADNLGGGPFGTSPDFVADDPVMVIGSRIAPDGEPEWAIGTPFRFTDQATESIDQLSLTLSRTPPRIPQVLRTGPATGNGVITQIGGQLQLETWAMFGDRTSSFVTLGSERTIYRSSNTEVMSVGEDGLVTAHACGVAMITASNLGVPAITTLVADEGAVVVDMEGICRLDGVPRPAAFIELVGGVATVSTGMEGVFNLNAVAVPATNGVRVRGEFTEGVRLWSGVSAAVFPVDGMIVDLGIIDLVEQTGLVNAGFESGTTASYTTDGATSIVTALDVVLPSEGLYMAELTTGLTGSGGSLTNDSIVIPAEQRSLVFDLNFLSDEIDQASSFNDTVVVTLIPATSPPVEMLRMTVDELRSGTISTIPAPDGFDAQTGFQSIELDLGPYTSPGDVVQVNIALFNVGDSGGRSTVLLDLFRWE